MVDTSTRTHDKPAEHDAAQRSAEKTEHHVPLPVERSSTVGRTNGANGGYPDRPLEPPADVTATQEVEKHDQAVREQIKNAGKIRDERRAQRGDAPDAVANLPMYPRENPWKAGATNNGDIGRTTGFTMPLYDRRSEYQKHCEWPTVGYRPGTEPLELAYSDQEPDLPPEPWRQEWRARA